MAKQDERFIKVLNEGSTWTTNREIWVDKTTGVNYLWIASGYAGGLKELSYRALMAKKPEFVLEKAVRGMLPHGPLGYAMIKKLHVYAGPEHPHQAQKPVALELKNL